MATAADTFTRADSTDHHLGSANWTNNTTHGRADVKTNQADFLNDGTDGYTFVAMTGTPPSTVDHWAEITCVTTGSEGGATVRTNTGDWDAGTKTIACYSFMCRSDPICRVDYVNGSGFNTIASRSFNTTLTAGDVFRLEVSGTTIKLYQNGAQLGANITDSNIDGTTTGGQNWGMFGRTGLNFKCDNFNAADVGAASGGSPRRWTFALRGVQ